MDTLNIASLLLTVSALFAYINYRFIRLPTTIGIMVISLVFSVALVLLSKFGYSEGVEYAQSILSDIDFNHTLMHGMLSFLLFAGALHINLGQLIEHKWVIAVLASFGVVLNTFIVGVVAWYFLPLMGFNVSFIYCLLFGSLIAPTDPVAVMGILKTAGASKSLETKIAGESLFNDGVAVVVFLGILEIAVSGAPASPSHFAILFAQEAIGGALFGLVTGFIVLRMLKSVDNYQVEVLLTLALVTGGYAAAGALHLSAPIAVVVAGLMMGSLGRTYAMSPLTQERIDMFWELLDEVLNAVLFLIIGLEVILLDFSPALIITGVVLAVITVIARFVSIGLPVSLFRLRKSFDPHTIKILTWGGLRGGISVALALSMPAGAERDILVSLTYIIVVMSILIQGLTIQKLVAFAGGPTRPINKNSH